MWKHPPGKAMDKINSRWAHGLFVGVKVKSNELIVIDGDTKDVKFVTTVRRVPEEQRWCADNLRGSRRCRGIRARWTRMRTGTCWTSR
jgi:hypothetical protein